MANGVDHPIPASMYRRLAEAVEGFSESDAPVFFALDRNQPHNPFRTQEGVIAFPSEDAALEALAEADRSRYEVLGPCHGQAKAPKFEVVSVRYRDRDGNIYERKLEEGADMLCWSMSAFDKFFAPYYSDLFGFDKPARDRLGRHREEMDTKGFFFHIWPTIGGGFGIRDPGTLQLEPLDAGSSQDVVEPAMDLSK